MNPEWREIDIHGCDSLEKIAFGPICACKNNRRIWRHNASTSRSLDVRSTVLTSQCYVRTDRPWRQLRNERSMIVLANLCVQCIKIIHSLLVMWFANDIHSWLRHSWKSLANHLTDDQKIFIHGNACIILYIHMTNVKASTWFTCAQNYRLTDWRQPSLIWRGKAASMSYRRVYDDVIKWKHFPRYWPFVRGIHLSPVTSPHKDQWRGVWCFLWSATE